MPIGVYKRKKPAWNKGKKTGLTPKSAFKKGRSPWNKGVKIDRKKFPTIGHHTKHSSETILKMKKARLGKSAYWNKGEKSPMWKGGVTPINKILRQSFEYRLWRMAVFERDDYTCVWCKQRGGELNADHIKPFAIFPELRFAIDNGRTLCINCHKTTETYGIRTK